MLMLYGPTTAVTLDSHACVGTHFIGSAEMSLLHRWPPQLDTKYNTLLTAAKCSMTAAVCSNECWLCNCNFVPASLVLIA